MAKDLDELGAPRWLHRRPWAHLVAINHQVFQGFLFIYLSLLLAETLREGTVDPYIPLNVALLIVLATGLVAVVTVRQTEERADEPIRKRDWILVALVTIGAWLILWFQLRDFDWIQFPVSILGGLLVGLVALSPLMPNDLEPARTTGGAAERADKEHGVALKQSMRSPPGPSPDQVPTKRVVGTLPPGARAQARPTAPAAKPIFASCLACHTLNILPAVPTRTPAACVRCGATLLPKRPQPKP